MKKKELLTGDIVVTRNGLLGVILAEKEIVLYQTSGYDSLDLFDDDLRDNMDRPEFDIMKVYRAEGNAAIGFIDYEDVDPVYVREEA